MHPLAAGAEVAAAGAEVEVAADSEVAVAVAVALVEEDKIILLSIYFRAIVFWLRSSDHGDWLHVRKHETTYRNYLSARRKNRIDFCKPFIISFLKFLQSVLPALPS
jgi:hypothetical protein